MFCIETPTSNCRVSKEQQSSRYVVSGRSRIKRTKKYKDKQRAYKKNSTYKINNKDEQKVNKVNKTNKRMH